MQVIIALDIGDKRVGVAYSDPFGSYAVPSETYFRTGDARADAAALASLAEERGASVIVCGLPLNEDGTESVQTQKTRRFAAMIAACTALPVCFEDERCTTRAAREDLGIMGISAKRDKKKKAVDSLAAAYILESYLAKRRLDMKEETNAYTDEDSIVELVDDEGNTYRYEHLLTFSFKDEWYVALAQEGQGDDMPEEEVAIFRLVGDEDNEQLETIEDETLLSAVFAEFCAQYEEDEDDEETEDGEDGE